MTYQRHSPGEGQGQEVRSTRTIFARIYFSPLLRLEASYIFFNLEMCEQCEKFLKMLSRIILKNVDVLLKDFFFSNFK